jgi:hypothetical protein
LFGWKFGLENMEPADVEPVAVGGVFGDDGEIGV